jgi:hypothetical protein
MELPLATREANMHLLFTADHMTVDELKQVINPNG